MTIEGRDPTPEELADQLRKYHGKSPVKYDRVLRRVIKEAESLGSDHQRAVSQFMAELAGVKPSQQVGQPWTHDYDRVVLELVVRIDDRWFQSRDRVDYFIWEMQFSRDVATWEQYLQYFVKKSVGALADDPEQYAHFRRRLFVVTPQDRHSSRLCRATNDTGLNQDLRLRCYHGVVRSEPYPILASMFTTEFDPSATYRVSDSRPLGKCSCRCHRHPLDQTDPEYHIGGLSSYDDRTFVL